MSPERLSTRITALESRHSYRMSVRWNKTPGVLSILGSLILLSLVTYLYNELTYGALVGHDLSHSNLLRGGLPLLFVLGLLMLYVGVVHSVNTTRLIFTSHSLKVGMTPLPWKKELKFHTKNIVAFESHEHESGKGLCIQVIFSEERRSKCLLINLTPDETRAILRDLKTFHEKAKLRRAKKEHATGVQELVEA